MIIMTHPDFKPLGDPSKVQLSIKTPKQPTEMFKENLYHSIQRALNQRAKSEYVAKSHKFSKELLAKIHLRKE